MTKHLAVWRLRRRIRGCEPNRATEPQVPIQSSLVGQHDDDRTTVAAVYTITIK